jgi:hypothetical protein
MCDMPVDTTCAAFQPATLKPATLTPASGDVHGGGSTTTSLSTGAVIGIIVGSVFAVVVIIVAVVLRMRGRAGRSKQEMQNVEL